MDYSHDLEVDEPQYLWSLLPEEFGAPCDCKPGCLSLISLTFVNRPYVELIKFQ